MGSVCWDFPILGTASLSGSNNAAITMFKGSGIMDGLAREICQNSLDAKNKECPDSPVKVVFKLSYLNRSEFPVFSGYEEYVKQSVIYWQNNSLRTDKIDEFLSNIQEALSQDTIPMLTISDYNTSGLNGVDAVDGQRSFWKLLVDTEGISIKPDSNSAGSFGIGKNAPFAYSSLNMVFYNTLAQDGGRAFEGVTHLITSQREHNGTMRPTQPSGKYLYLEDAYTGRPIKPDDDCKLAKIPQFQRTEIGTDVAIIGFKLKEYQDWEKATAVAILKNFILAIYDGKLEVVIESPEAKYEINKNELDRLLFDLLKDELQLKYTKQIYETVTKTTPRKVAIAEKDDLSIYIRYDDGYTASLSRFRSTGMLINTTYESLPHYSIVIVVNDIGESDLSKTLREAEPPQHTEWKAKNITDNRTLHNKAAKYIRNISKAIQKVLDEFEKAEITDKMDAGIGNYLPDAAGFNNAQEGTDGLRTDIKISQIENYNGDVLYNNQYESGAASNGKASPNSGTKTGTKKRKRKKKERIPVVKPDKGTDTGVAPGKRKVKISTPTVTEHRTFYLAANKYRAYIKSPKAYDNVYIQYYAGREDDSQDAVKIKSVKPENSPLIVVDGPKVGPLTLREGGNVLYLEFENEEIMAVSPVFTMEVVSDET